MKINNFTSIPQYSAVQFAKRQQHHASRVYAASVFVIRPAAADRPIKGDGGNATGDAVEEGYLK